MVAVTVILLLFVMELLSPEVPVTGGLMRARAQGTKIGTWRATSIRALITPNPATSRPSKKVETGCGIHMQYIYYPN